MYRVREHRGISLDGPDGRWCFLDVRASAIYEVGPVGATIVALLARAGELATCEVLLRLRAAWPADSVQEAWAELTAVGLVEPVGAGAPAELPPVPDAPPLTSLVCLLSEACNLRCAYCYATPARSAGRTLPEPVARAGVDLLVAESGAERDLRLTLFGGEPLLNRPALASLVRYGKARAAAVGKRLSLSMTTNATLLDADAARFLDEEGVALTVSVDGPRETHDALRRFPDGRGSYDAVRRALACALPHYRRPIRARVTLTRRSLDLEGILAHLLDLGFSEVGFAPVTSSAADLALSEADLEVFTVQLAALADRFVERALRGEHLGCANLSGTLRLIHEGTRKSHPCGGGGGLMAMDTAGGLFLCHRLVGREDARLGSVHEGIDRVRQRALLAGAHLREKQACVGCWARLLCGGGCYHEAVVHGGALTDAPGHHCTWLRRWFDIGLRAYARIAAGNPEFLSRLGAEAPRGRR